MDRQTNAIRLVSGFSDAETEQEYLDRLRRAEGLTDEVPEDAFPHAPWGTDPNAPLPEDFR